MSDKQVASLSPAGKLAVLGGGTLPALATGTIAVMLPAITDAFSDGTNGVQIKMVSTALGFGMLFGAPIGGALADRFGRRITLLVAMTVFGIVGCGIMLMTELWQIITARFIIGLTTGAMGVTVAALIGDSFQGAERNRWIGFNAAVGTFFMLLANPIAGALADIGWRYGFALYALAVPVLLTVIIGVPAARAKTVATPAAAKPKGLGGVAVSALILAVMVGTLATGTSLYWPFRFRELGVTSARDIAFYALPNIIMVGAAALSYGVISRSLSVSRIFLLGAIASSIGLAAMALATSPWMVLVGLAIEGCAIGLLTPNLTAYVLIVSPPDWRARNVGLVKGALYGSPFLTQFFLEPLNQIGGAASPLWGISAMAGVLAIAVLTGGLGHPHQRSNPA